MDWHNFKVMSTYAVIIFVVLLLTGQIPLAFVALIGYSVYGLYLCIKAFVSEAALGKNLNSLGEPIKSILVCYFTKRHPKLKRSVKKRIKNDILNQNFVINSYQLTERKSQPNSPDPDSGFSFLLTFTNGKTYSVYNIVYYKARVGDSLWVVETPSDTLLVMQNENEYFNMFTYNTIKTPHTER